MIWSFSAPASMLLGNLRVELVDQVLVVAPVDDLRHEPAPLFTQHAREVAELISPDSQGVVVDLELAFDRGCSDRILGLLCMLWKRTKQHNLRVVLCNLSPALSAVLGRTRLDHLLLICNTRAEAIERLKG